jgi:hypothetical protein
VSKGLGREQHHVSEISFHSPYKFEKETCAICYEKRELERMMKKERDYCKKKDEKQR